jgi:predicted nucleotidyltransferase
MVELSNEQWDWIQEVTKDKDIVFMTIHGSHLYGLDRPGSDIDIKAIFMPSKHDLLLGQKTKTISKSNDELEIEIEMKSLSSFLSSAKSADTNVMDMLWTPPEYWLHYSDVWVDICDNSWPIVSKNMRGIIGYIKTHANKYTNKINRLNEMKELLTIATCRLPWCGTVKELMDDGYFKAKEFKYIRKVLVETDHEQNYLEICGKKYIETWRTVQVIEAIEKEIARYGKRSQEGVSTGLDTKSLSHAVRVLSQLEELVVDNKITFPLKEAEFIKKIKLGEVSLGECMSEIDERYERCMKLLEESDLPQESDITGMLNVVETYFF